MAAVGVEVGGSLFMSSGVVSFFILLVLLSIFLTALCSSCRRQSFELQHPEGNRNPSSLVRVVRLEETVGGRENPLANEIQRDEKDGQVNGSAVVTRASEPEPDTEEEVGISYIRWRSHLGAPQGQDGNSASSSDSEPDYQVVDERRSNRSDTSPPTANQAPEEAQRSDSAAAGNLSERDRNSMYAQVSKRVRAPPVDTVEVVQVVEEEEEESSPPLPDRMEG